MPNIHPKWSRRLLSSKYSYTPSYQELKNIYCYLRSTRTLIERRKSNNINGKIMKQLDFVLSKKGFSQILDIKQITHSLSKIGLGAEKTLKQKKQLLQIKAPESSLLEQKLLYRLTNYLTNGAKQTRSTEWQWRLQTAVYDAVINNKWYPLFGTYTVDPKILPFRPIPLGKPTETEKKHHACHRKQLYCLNRDELWTKTPAWDRFIKKFKTDIAESLGYGRKPSKWPKTNTFFQYFAVIEHGKSLEHPHIHVVFLCKNIPKSWKRDPNRQSKSQPYTEFNIPAASTNWIHGDQKVTSAIFISGSPFIDKLKWKIPSKFNKETKTYKKVTIGDAGAVAGYIAKYMGKSGEKQWNHRIKATKNLGLKQIRTMLINLKSRNILTALANRPNSYNTTLHLQQNTSAPLSLLRKLSKAELEKRWFSSRTEQDEQFLWSKWTAKPKNFYLKLMRLVETGLRPWSQTPEQRYKLFTQMLGEIADSIHSKKIIENTIKYLDTILEPMLQCNSFTLLQPKGT